MKTIRTTALAALAAASLIAVTTTSASASVGNNVIVSTASQPGSWVNAYNSNGAIRTIYRGYSTAQYSGWVNDAQAFAVPSNCIARSQYSPPGAYPYVGGYKYTMNVNNTQLILTITCTI